MHRWKPNPNHLYLCNDCTLGRIANSRNHPPIVRPLITIEFVDCQSCGITDANFELIFTDHVLSVI